MQKSVGSRAQRAGCKFATGYGHGRRRNWRRTMALTAAAALAVAANRRVAAQAAWDGGGGFITFAGTNVQTLGGSGQVSFGLLNYTLNNNTGANVLTFGPGLLVHGQNATFNGNGAGGFMNLATVAADVAGGTFTFNR